MCTMMIKIVNNLDLPALTAADDSASLPFSDASHPHS